ncbi:MAG: glycosyltransferase, partial [Deltaproteobacteria bacterium]|nr:glycosyltransferase [Deltaproteobacteria bacterium]
SALRYAASYAAFLARACAEISARHVVRRYDVVYVHTMPDLMVMVGLLARALGAKIVLDVHDTMPELYQSKFDLNERHPLVAALKLSERLSCAFAHRVIAVHEPHRDLLVRRGVDAAKISVVMNLPDPAVFGEPAQGAAADGPLRVVYHGTMARRLGLDLAVRAFAQVAADFPESRFDIYGTGDFAQQVEACIDATGQSERIGFANQRFAVQDVPRLLAGATLGVVPNRRDSATEIMLPVKLLEYAHLGIPVVAPRLAAVQHYFSDAAVTYFEPGEVASLAQAMRRLVASPELRAEQRAQGLAFAVKHTWQNMQNELFKAVDG